MKCQYLLTIPPYSVTSLIVKDSFSDTVAAIPTSWDIKICSAKSAENCPKKKQPCQINARCWRLG